MLCCNARTLGRNDGYLSNEAIVDADKLRAFLNSIPAEGYGFERDFTGRVVPPFIELLGYPDSLLFFDVRLGDSRARPDAVVAAERTARPWLLIEVKASSQEDLLRAGENQLRGYRQLASPEAAVLLSPSYILILYKDQRKLHKLGSVSLEDAITIFAILKYPGELPVTRLRTPRLERRPDQTRYLPSIWNPSECRSLLQAVRSARTNEEKGRSLEDMAAWLFSTIPFLQVKYRNLITSSSEIDLVIQNNGFATKTIFDESGRYALAECKNWAVPVGAKHIRDFILKLEKTRTRLGFVFARNGITGSNHGADALREIQRLYDSDEVFVLVVSEDDLQAICDGGDFLGLIDEKVDRLRFDF